MVDKKRLLALREEAETSDTGFVVLAAPTLRDLVTMILGEDTVPEPPWRRRHDDPQE